MRLLSFRNDGLVRGVLIGGFLGTPVLFPSASAAQNSVINPCPRIYYEEPYNSRLIVPQGCPPNAITRSTSENPNTSGGVGGTGGNLPQGNLAPNQSVPSNTSTTPSTVRQRPSIFNEPPYNRTVSPATPITRPIQPPLPEQQSPSVATVVPTNGTINVRLKNDTNTIVIYQAIQYTERRSLAPGEEVLLQNVPVPVTLTFGRQDNGFVAVIPTNASERGLLSLSLDEDTNPRDQNQGVIRVERSGQVFLN